MTALAADRNTNSRECVEFSYPVAASVKCYRGAMAVLDSSGNVKPGVTATGLIAVGRFKDQVDNSSGLAAALNATVEAGCFKWVNGSSMTKANIGDTVYVVDDQTVSHVSTGKSPAGVLTAVDSDGVWVITSPASLQASAGLLAANNLSDLGTLATAQANLGLTDGTIQARFEDVTVDDDLIIGDDVAVNTDKFTIDGGTGNTAIAGTCAVAGALTGLQKTQTVAGSAYTVVSATDGDIVIFANADNDVVTLPDAAAANKGQRVTVICGAADGGALVSVSPHSSDGIYGSIANAAADSVASGTADKDLQLTKATQNKGDRVTLISDGSSGWFVAGGVGIWASEA